jgi:RNA polymerase sigma factor (sigma-70 family)
MTTMSRPAIEDDLTSLLEAAQRGDPAAWESLFHEFYPKIRRVVRQKLNPSLRSVFDSTDFASDVMKSLAANFDRLSFTSMESLVAFLKKVAERKVIDEYRRHHTIRRDHSRDRPITARSPDGDDLQLPSDEPTASQVAQANEVNARLLARVSPTGRMIVQLKLQNYSNADIAAETGWNIRKVQRYLKDLQESMNDPGE